MTGLMEILKIQLEEHVLIKYCMIKHLILLTFQNILKESNRKPKKLWVDKGREFY